MHSHNHLKHFSKYELHKVNIAIIHQHWIFGYIDHKQSLGINAQLIIKCYETANL